MTPVLADPDIKEPGAIAFDGNGRMFVLELRGYMQDADATGELDPVGRISRHEDADNDGVYERHTVFVDKLVFPRFVMPFGPNSVLTMESNADEVWQFTDTNNDGVSRQEGALHLQLRAVRQRRAPAGLPLLGNGQLAVQHSERVPRAMDPEGRRPRADRAERRAVGVTQDNDGKMWFQGGASGLPSYFQFPIHYGSFDRRRPVRKGFQHSLGCAGSRRRHAAGHACRTDAGRIAQPGHGFGRQRRVSRRPAARRICVGDYIYGEPVGRIVRRVKPVVTEGLTQLRNAYPGTSSSGRPTRSSGPVDMATAPDGTLYIADMYRGIIQQATWSGPGTYLRARIDQYTLDKVFAHGRIWRLSYEGKERDRTQPRMLNETAAQLVAHLDPPERLVAGQRAAAARVEAGQIGRARAPAADSTPSTGYARREPARPIPRAVDPRGPRRARRRDSARADERPQPPDADSGDSRQRNALQGRRSHARRRLPGLATDKDTNVSIQALLTLNYLKAPNVVETVRAAQAASTARGVQEIGNQILKPAASAFGRGGRGGPPPFSPAELAVMERGEGIYKEVCFACHGDDGRGTAQPGAAPGTTMAPSLANSIRVQGHRDYITKTLLHGMDGPIDGRSYAAGVMAPMGTNRDEWVAAIASYVRNSFGNVGSFVSPADVARVRAATADRKTFWKVDELVASLPVPLEVLPTWKATASHNPGSALGALNFASWSTGEPQQAGMWFQVELPEPAMVTELQFNSAGGGFAGGGRGGGRANVPLAPGTPPPAPLVQPGPYPRAYKVEVSTNGTTWTTVAEGQGTTGSTTITFTPTAAKYIRITQTDAAENAAPWAMQRLRLYRPGPALLSGREGGAGR